MSDLETVDERLRAVERALTDDDNDLTDLQDAAELTREIDRLATRLDEVEERLDELDAATQALRGYVGNVRAVNQSVESRADAALAKAESVEAKLGKSKSDDVQSPPSDDVQSPPVEAVRRARVCGCECECERGREVSPRRGESERDTHRMDRERTTSFDSERDDSECDSPGLLARIAEVL
jgi:DNA repair exonuclease SbcCD ATPase subunit